ncbi:MAG: phage late control D family protein [Oscillatoria sp. SIO1A7]|nr:phage late control D family protein [Oscillatoria sp. SIO1A7]
MSTIKTTLVPEIKILIKERPLPIEAELAVLSLRVLQDLEAPAMFELKLNSWDTLKSEITWLDDELLEIGNTVEVQIGYRNNKNSKDNLKKILIGEITGLEPEFSEESSPSAIARGYDLLHRLVRGRKTRSFTNMKDSSIASQIAREHNLGDRVKDSNVKLDYVLQANQTDLEFLLKRARLIGYELFVEGKDLYFQPPQNNETEVLTLEWGQGIIEFYFNLSTMSQVDMVEVYSWNPQQKKALIGKANQTEKMQGSKSGPDKTKKAFGKSTYSIVKEPVYTQEEADKVAKGQFNDMALDYITGEGTCVGHPELRAGKTIEIKGVGKRFSGLYYVTYANHLYSEESGYCTEISVRRNAT